ncbi:MAG: hypothetical protein HOV83_38460 [Catenulispora sp.]|nr:hypothetical protein [Catenulispora sp.]
MSKMSKMSRAGRKRVAAVLIAAALAAAGCSSSGSSGSGSGGVPKTLADALKGVHAADTTKTQLAWGQYGGARGVQFDVVLSPVLGFSVVKQPFALTVGKPPNELTVLYGSFDPASIGAKLKGLGYQATDRGHGETQWLIRDDHKVDMDQKPEDLANTLATYNVIRVSKDRLVYGGATADLDAALPAQGAALADDPVVGAIAKCLDEGASGMFDTTAVPLGVGVGPSGTETICVSAADDATAKKYADKFVQQATTGKSARTLQPWSELIANPKAEVLGGKGHVVRLTVTDVVASRPVLVTALLTGDVGTLIGLPLPNGKLRPGASSPTPSAETSS